MMNIPKEKFAPAKNRDVYHDKKLETKPIGYFKDAWLRFRKNKGSVFAFGIIVFLVLFAIFVPMLSPYTVAYDDMYFKYNYPRNKLFVRTEDSAALLSEYENAAPFEDGVIINLRSPSEKGEIMRSLSEKYDIDELRIFEPSLNDIFVEYAEGGI